MKSKRVTRNPFLLYKIHFTSAAVIRRRIMKLPSYIRPCVASIIAFDNFEHSQRPAGLLEAVSDVCSEFMFDYVAKYDPGLDVLESGLIRCGYTREQAYQRLKPSRFGSASPFNN